MCYIIVGVSSNVLGYCGGEQQSVVLSSFKQKCVAEHILVGFSNSNIVY